MRCEKHNCSLKQNCKNYLKKAEYKIIITNPTPFKTPEECSFHLPLKAM